MRLPSSLPLKGDRRRRQEVWMVKRHFLFIGLPILFLISLGCAGPSRLETDFGASSRLMKVNQIFDPKAGEHIEPVWGFDGKAGEVAFEKYRKDFEKPAPPVPYTFSIGVSGK